MNKLLEKSWMELGLITQDRDKEIIIAMIENKSLGTILENNISKLYFPVGLKENIEVKLQQLETQFAFSWSWKLLLDNNWHLNWKDNFKPISISQKIIVVPSWDNVTSADIIVKIEPGRAFGTGHHQTTFMAIQTLEKLIKNGSSVLDLGSGSGILAIASKLLGAGRVDAVELDNDCLENFKKNLEYNNLTGAVNYFDMDVLDWEDFHYDIIVININCNTILEILPNLTKSPAIILITGLLKTDKNKIYESCKNLSFIIKNFQSMDEWIALEITNV